MKAILLQENLRRLKEISFNAALWPSHKKYCDLPAQAKNFGLGS